MIFTVHVDVKVDPFAHFACNVLHHVVVSFRRNQHASHRIFRDLGCFGISVAAPRTSDLGALAQSGIG